MANTDLQQAQRAAAAKTEQRLAESHTRLLDNNDFQTHLHWLMETLVTQRTANDLLEGAELYRGQGKARTLAEIFKKVDTSDKTLLQLRTQESKRIRAGR